MPESYRPPEDLRIDALLVLGRGVDKYGVLSEASAARAEAAVTAAMVLVPRVVVFSGGRSWRQVAGDMRPPSEGRGMYSRASNFAQEAYSRQLADFESCFLPELNSESTVANFVYSKRFLDLHDGETLGIMSDEAHFENERPQYISSKVYPNNPVEILPLPNLRSVTRAERREERVSTFATKVALAGVEPGNMEAIMQRQRTLEYANQAVRRALPFLG